MPLTATQIVTRACEIAKCPGYIVQGGQYLNLVLKDLWLHRDLKVNRKTQSLVITAGTTGPFSLETDYQRTYDLFYLQNGLPYFLNQAGNLLYDRQFKSSSISNYPYLYTTDVSVAAQAASSAAGQIYIYPPSSGGITLTHRYMQQQADIVTPETSSVVPWFIDQDWLIMATAARLMKVTDDDRLPQFNTDLETMLRTHLIMVGDDEQQTVRQVTLDPWAFRGSRSSRSTKVTG